MTGKEFRLSILGCEKIMTCQEDEPLLFAINRQGYKNLPVGCRQGGCGVCKIRVLEGEFETGKMSEKHVAKAERKFNFTLACKTFPKSDLTITTEI